MDQVPSHPLGRDFVNAFHPGESRQAKKMINRSLIFEYRWKLLTLLLALALLATGLVRWWQGPEVAIEKVVRRDFVQTVVASGHVETPHRADIVGVSALLTTTMTGQRAVVEGLAAAGLRPGVKVIVGGAPVTRAWAAEIGADGYSEDAMGAVALATRLMDGADAPASVG